MKTYRHSFSDWICKLMSMSMVEQAAFRSLADFRITHDRAISVDLQQAYRMCGAFSASEKAAVRRVIAEHYEQVGDKYVCAWLEGLIGEQVEAKARFDRLREKSAWNQFRRLVLERDNHTCVYCKATGVPLDVDHVMPRSRGGEDSLENLVAACVHCNRSKGARTPEEWRG